MPGKSYDKGLRDKAVRLVRDHVGDYPTEWAAIKAVSGRLGMSAGTLRKWLRQSEVEGLRESNPVGRGRYTSRGRGGGYQRGHVPKLPWIPTEAQWREILAVAANEPVRNHVMLALAFDAALRREELCSLRTDDLDPAHRARGGRILSFRFMPVWPGRGIAGLVHLLAHGVRCSQRHVRLLCCCC